MCCIFFRSISITSSFLIWDNLGPACWQLRMFYFISYFTLIYSYFFHFQFQFSNWTHLSRCKWIVKIICLNIPSINFTCMQYIATHVEIRNTQSSTDARCRYSTCPNVIFTSHWWSDEWNFKCCDLNIYLTFINSSSLDKEAAISRQHFQTHFREWKTFVFRFEFHWSLFLKVQLTIS